MSENKVKEKRNNTSFPVETYEHLKAQSHENKSQLYHQFIVSKYLMYNPTIRGMLLFHGMGMGKTRLSITLASYLKSTSGFKRVIIVAPKSVFGQFEKNIKRSSLNLDDITFLSLQSPKKLEKLEDGLDNSIIIVDEAHNLFNSISNGSEHSVDFYDVIMHAKNIKLLFLTGSPIINDPFEMVPCFNMLAGKLIFPETSEDFYRNFITKDWKNFKNKNIFKNRIVGLVSYFGEWIRGKSDDIPEELPMKVIDVPMSEVQYAVYQTWRDKEEDESKMSSSNVAPASRFNPRSSSGTYRMRTRQASNVVPFDGTISDAMLKNKKHCPKFHETWNIIKKHKGQNGIVYCDFVNNAGLRDFGRFLKLNGVNLWEKGKTSAGRKYAILSGDQTQDERKQMVEIYNSQDNIDGSIISMILLGPAGSEGVNLLNSRWGVIIGPYFNYTRLDQVKHRIIRFRSHKMLPEKDRNVQIYLLLATWKGELTTDQHIFKQAKKKYVITLKAYRMLVEASVDCSVHKDNLPASLAKKITCMKCAPTNSPLWSNDLEDDIEGRDPCEKAIEEKITVKTLILDSDGEEITYKYREVDGKFEFFSWNDRIQGYELIRRDHPHFDSLFDKVQGSLKTKPRESPKKAKKPDKPTMSKKEKKPTKHTASKKIKKAKIKKSVVKK
jgi:superfamily II DNA or RNA helicase